MSKSLKIRLSMPFVDKEDINAVTDALRSGMLVQGPRVDKFEKKFASYMGTSYAVAVSSGTAALHCAIHALGIRPGDEVITTPFTFIASATAPLYEGASIVFADISPDDFLITPQTIAKKITKKTKAIITVDLFGKLCDYKGIESILPKNISIVEDACQAIGAERNGKKSGTYGTMAAFSLYATKNIMVGEGGMLTTDVKDYAYTSRLYKNVGQSDRYVYESLGYHYRMPEISAALGISQLRKLEYFTKIRQKNAQKLMEELLGLKGIILPFDKGSDHVYHQFVIRVLESCKHTRDEIVLYMQSQGIQTGVYYPKPLHLYNMFTQMGYKEGDFPIAEQAAREVLALPVHPLLSESDLDFIIQSLRSFIQ